MLSIKKIEVLGNQPMADFTTFKIGGPAKELYFPKNKDEIIALVRHFNKMNQEYIVLGNGSNLLVSDDGIDIPIIKIDKGLSSYVINQNLIKAESGMLLSELASIAARNGLSGLEFASGIPGSLGGAIFMNAGAYGGEMSNVITEVEIIDRDGKIRRLKNGDMEFGYRSSFVKKHGGIIISAEFELKEDGVDKIKARVSELAEKRNAKQPLNLPSAGSIFKRPEGHYAGMLIENSGLKGYTIGGAQVSEKHCGFIVNIGGATASDVNNLIEHIKKTVLEKYNVILETEICVLP